MNVTAPKPISPEARPNVWRRTWDSVSIIFRSRIAVIGLAMSQIRTRYAIMVGVLTVLLSALTVWRKGYFRMQGLCSPVVEKGLHASNSTQDSSD